MILHTVFTFECGANDEYGAVPGDSIAHLVLHSQIVCLLSNVTSLSDSCCHMYT